jgi:predicted Zn-dependent protease
MFMTALLRYARQAGARLVCAGLAASLTAMPLAHAQPVGIPSMGAASFSELSPELERILGDALMEHGLRDPTYIGDPDIDQYLTDMGRKLVAQSRNGAQHIQVFAVRDPQINAFTLPGGYIGVNSGLVVATRNESELASVVAHEVGHVVMRHIARGMTEQSKTGGLMVATLVGALLAALSGSGDLAMGVAAFGQAAAIDKQLSFSRSAEQEADREGFRMLTRAGYDPRGMVQMFRALMGTASLNEGAGGNPFAQTHPLSIQRLSDIENRVSQMRPVHYQDTNAYWFVRAKLRALQAGDDESRRGALSEFQAAARESSGAARSAAWYGAAFIAWQGRDLDKAATALDQARVYGDSPEIAELAVAIANDRGHGGQALSLARSAWKQWPQSQGVALSLARTLQQAGDASAEASFLEARIRQWPDLPVMYKWLAQAHEQTGKKVEARRTMAKYYELIGALPSAVEQLNQARGLSHDFYVQSELDAQIRDLRQRLDTERDLLKRFKVKP